MLLVIVRCSSRFCKLNNLVSKNRNAIFSGFLDIEINENA